MSTKLARVKDFSEYVGEYFKKTVYMDDCKSWYMVDGGLGDRISGLWPGSILQVCEAFRMRRWEECEFGSLHENGLKWLGSGWSTTLMKGGDAAYYLEEGVVDVLMVGKPEKDERYKGRPWSH